MSLISKFGLALAAFALCACGGGSGSPLDSNLRVLLSDSPIDGADEAWVTIERLETIRMVGGEEVFETVAEVDQAFDLLQLQNDVTAVLGEGSFEPGLYEGIRLILAPRNPGPGGRGLGVPPEDLSHWIVIDGEIFPLKVPSGEQTGIKLLDPFRITADVLTELRIDFNVRTSVVRLGKKDEYILKPRLTMIETIVSGAINGSVETSGASPLEGATVSAQQEGEELLSTRTKADGSYRLSPLLPGSYTLVVTASGFATEVLEDEDVLAGDDLQDRNFVLETADTGSISGTTITGDETAEIHLILDGNFIAKTGPDTTTGEFSFEDVSVGTYDLALIVDGGETARLEDVEVTADTETSGLSLGLD